MSAAKAQSAEAEGVIFSHKDISSGSGAAGDQGSWIAADIRQIHGGLLKSKWSEQDQQQKQVKVYHAAVEGWEQNPGCITEPDKIQWSLKGKSDIF